MLRTSSQGADVREDEAGNEWEVLEPHGTGKGQGRRCAWEEEGKMKRRHSQDDIMAYQDTEVEPVYVSFFQGVC
jgi:hypothetical protein